MDAKSFAQVALRLMAVLLVLGGLVGLPNVVMALMDHSAAMDAKVDIRFFILSVLTPFILGIVLWLASPILGRWIAGKAEPPESSVPLNVTRAQAVAFIVLGAWLAIKSLSELLVFVSDTEMGGDPYFWREVLELVLSLCLIAGAKSLARLTQKVRDFGAAQDQN